MSLFGKLGKLAVRYDTRTMHMADYVNLRSMPANPPARDWTEGMPADLGMMLNDQIGDCAYAAPGHMVQVWTANRGAMVTLADSAIEKAYEATGYRPGQPQTDNGSVMLDVCKQWRTDGIGGHKVGAFVKVDHRDQEHVRAAINLFGGVYVGANLPQRAQMQLQFNATWDVRGTLHGVDSPGSWGGHAMGCGTYDRNGPTLLTWGKRQAATWSWWLAYVDECYALVSMDWVSGAALAPSGVDVAGLNAALERIAA